jgi:hypothetical protein
MDRSELDALDSDGYVVLDAITHVKAPPGATLATPHAFAALSGKIVWVKAAAQQGLVAELVAGRLADRVGAGPLARIIRVPVEALPPDGSANHLEGVVVGTDDLAGGVNDRELAAIGGGPLDPAKIDPTSRARVVAFQTWLGVGDNQVLIDVARGLIYSIDHGQCLENVGTLSDPVLVVHPIPGLPNEHGRDAACIDAAVAEIESVSDAELLEAVARVPSGGAWQSDADRRFAMAAWLSHRRDRIRGVMSAW